ncbi:hypothetical protein DEI89_07410 [Curtobacterium sp. MCBD17_030]|nr:hypothetical protein DEI89_07410 [Curtobacterium sp. MCBD17_030]
MHEQHPGMSRAPSDQVARGSGAVEHGSGAFPALGAVTSRPCVDPDIRRTTGSTPPDDISGFPHHPAGSTADPPCPGRLFSGRR